MATDTTSDMPRSTLSRVGRAARKLLKIAGITLASLILLVVLLLVLGRLYFSDERLRTIAEEQGKKVLQTELKIGGLEISLWSGFEVRDVRIGPPQGFSRDLLSFRRLALHWSTAELVRLHLVIPEMAFEGLRLTLEENEHGQNLQVLLATLKGPAGPPVEKPPAPTEKKPLVVEQPSLPVRVEVGRLSFTIDSVEIIKPTQELSIDKIGMQGHLEGEGQSMSLELWLGLGDREAGGAASHFRMRGGKPFAEIDSEQRFGVTLKSSGLGDLQLGIALDADTRLKGTTTLAPLKTSFALESALNLLTQHLELTECRLRMGQGTELAAIAVVDQLLAAPTVHVAALSFASDLTELAPLLEAVAPQLSTRGRVRFSAEPFDVTGDPKALDTLTATLRFDLEDFDYRTAAMTVAGMSLETTTALSPGKVGLHLKTKIGTYLQGKQEARNITADLEISTPMAPWLGGPADGSVDIVGTIGVGRYALPTFSVDGLDMPFDMQIPMPLMKSLPGAPPLTTRMRMKLRETQSVGYTVRNLNATISAQSWDLVAHRMIADVKGVAAEALAPDGKEMLNLGRSSIVTWLSRNGDDYGLKGFDFDSGPAFRLRIDGFIKESLGPAPVFESFKLVVGPIDLPTLLPLLPADQQPKAAIRGSVEMKVALDGRVPYKDLIPKTRPPKLERPEDQGDTAKLAAAYRDYLQYWQNEFERGLPFSSSFTLALHDLSYADDKNDARGIDMVFTSTTTPHTAGMTYTLDVGEVQKPISARGISMGLDFALDQNMVAAGYRLRAAALERESLTRPLEKAGMELKLSYKIDGDLLLDRFLMEAPDRGLLLEASGVMSKPFQFLLTKGWERSGLPGLDATLRCAFQLDSGQQKPITKDGPELGGKVGLSGTLRAVDGVIGIDGVLETAHLSYVSGPTLVDEMSGALPFDLKLAFDPRPDATVLKRGLSIGGGVLALVTSAEDIRRRPARPTYYERIRAYRQRPGLSARAITSAGYEITDFELEGRLTQGMLLADWMAMHILGGDVTGNMALQLGRDATVRGDLAFKISNIDASYFKALSLQPGPDSELSADMQLGLLLGPKSRDLTMNMNITKIGSETFDRFLQILDPTAKDDKIQKNRKYMSYVRIDNVGLWMRYESLNMDLDVTTFLRIPGTSLGFPNIDRELLRRYSLTDRLDEIFNPLNAKYLVPFLGWNRAG